ncbi:DNA ligase D [Nitratireductor mangrovi]|uniref:DNA ligase (ATP) n=1 Tax=Nitratireductor mangrovi TaxID=2599600 RepID=A0A5B8L4X0_9HYPH|nr:DNA ligase D [Nitratireductor mangrovi]QDZ03086.1 DNA ligase D [Nitratireductor mangrovi]
MATQKLGDYQRKRDFSRTGEPEGQETAASGNRFVMHKHSASADHYDLRLELDGVLKSWAVPKGPSLNPDDKRLAVETEDHPLEYIDFEGVIPEGEYGGGPMIVWDTGVWAPMDDAEKSLAAGAFKFRLAGAKLNGGWMLTRLKPKPGEGAKKNWLLFKERDRAADRELDIIEARPESVKSGRRIEDLVAPERLPAKPPKLVPGRLSGAVRSAMPERVSPQLATPAERPPSDKDWLHEIKFDGYRTIALVDEGKARLMTRKGLDWTKRYGDVGQAFAGLPCKEAVIDGEIVALDDRGVSRFSLLQQALSDGAGNRLVFYAFDLIHLDGWDLRKVSLVKRKDLLSRLLAGQVSARSPIQFSDHVAGDGAALFDQASELGLEGIISKDARAPYREERTRSWLKVKALQSGDFVIAGYTVSEAAEGLAALALGEWENGELQYRGKVGSGFDAAALADLLNRLEPLSDGAANLDGAPKDVIAVRPVLTAHIHYANRTADNMLRHAVYKGLREAELSGTKAEPRERLITDADLASIWVTNPTRRLFGKSGPTKLDIAVYYALVGDFMLPHILGRPVSLVRCPTGKPQDCFFQRHAFSGMPSSVATFQSTNSDGETKSYLSVEGVKGYLALAQFGVVEFHIWGTTAKRLEKADRMVFDLDPGEGVEWREMVEAAVHIKGELEAMGLAPFVKTSGGKGLHITVPVKAKLSWKQLHQRSGGIAAAIAATAPDTFTTNMAKDKRRNRIFVDFHRNARGATAVAPYSLRARTNLPASTPLSWSDLESIDAPEDLNYSSLPGLLTSSGDPWADISDFAREMPPPSNAGA